MIARELTHLAGEQRRAIREQDLGFGEAAGIQEQLAGRGMRRVVLVTEADVEVAQGDPRRLAAPPRLDELLGQREQGLELLACLRRALGLEARCEAQPRDLDFDVYARDPAAEVVVCLRVSMPKA
jgi:hypothetical protein